MCVCVCRCAAAGIHVLLYDWRGGYPWSKLPVGTPPHELITVVQDWDEVQKVLGRLSVKHTAMQLRG